MQPFVGNLFLRWKINGDLSLLALQRNCPAMLRRPTEIDRNEAKIFARLDEIA